MQVTIKIHLIKCYPNMNYGTLVSIQIIPFIAELDFCQKKKKKYVQSFFIQAV